MTHAPGSSGQFRPRQSNRGGRSLADGLGHLRAERDGAEELEDGREDDGLLDRQGLGAYRRGVGVGHVVGANPISGDEGQNARADEDAILPRVMRMPSSSAPRRRIVANSASCTANASSSCLASDRPSPSTFIAICRAMSASGRPSWQVASQYLVQHLTHRGALWASGAAQAAQFVRIILRFAVSLLRLRGGLTRLEKPDFSTHNPSIQLTKKALDARAVP